VILRRFFLGLAFFSAFAAHAGEVQVAAAANLGPAIRQLASAFQQATGHHAVVALASTGKFYAQVRNGAPFEVLLAADEETPRRMEAEGLGVAGSRFTYATGRLVLWSAQPGVVDREGAVLRRPPRGKLAIADPRLAPYGAAAIETLRKLGVLAAWEPQLVQGENIAQAYQYAATGNATLGFVALSQVVAGVSVARVPPPNPPPGGEGYRFSKGSGWIVPEDLHPPLKQDALLLRAGAGNPAAVAFLEWLRGTAAQGILRAAGYAT
jgi:molybdate transport system substrate-binding protein